MKKRSRVFYTFFVLFLLLSCGLMLGCGAKDKDSGNIEEKPKVSPPSFTVIPQTVPLPNGGDGIVFSAKSDKNITLTRVDITDPAGDKGTIKFYNNGYLADELFKLQTANWPYYTKMGGTWSFKFTGNLSSTKEQFIVTVTVNVSA